MKTKQKTERKNEAVSTTLALVDGLIAKNQWSLVADGEEMAKLAALTKQAPGQTGEVIAMITRLALRKFEIPLHQAAIKEIGEIGRRHPAAVPQAIDAMTEVFRVKGDNFMAAQTLDYFRDFAKTNQDNAAKVLDSLFWMQQLSYEPYIRLLTMKEVRQIGLQYEALAPDAVTRLSRTYRFADELKLAAMQHIGALALTHRAVAPQALEILRDNVNVDTALTHRSKNRKVFGQSGDGTLALIAAIGRQYPDMYEQSVDLLLKETFNRKAPVRDEAVDQIKKALMAAAPPAPNTPKPPAL